ncbi:MAG: hypothetical protein AAF204_02685 [Pseudomonadota bacterium]
MAKKKVSKKKASKKAANKKGAKKQKGFTSAQKTQMFMIVTLMMSIAFLSSAMILFIGLLPTFVAFFVDRTKKKTKAVTVGAMNLAGCMPFLMELWMSETTMTKAFSIVLDPMAIIVMYSAAGVGYIIDWALTLIVAGVLFQRGTSRKKAIEKRQAELIERWGEEVSGRIPIDAEGFPLDDTANASDGAKS